MMPSAMLLFANDVRPEGADTYETWHRDHHVPQRFSVPGILAAARYHKHTGQGPEYVTLYDLAAADVLDGPAYRALIDHPDPPTLAMRPNLINTQRLVAALAVSHGAWPPDMITPVVVDDFDGSLMVQSRRVLRAGPLIGDVRPHPVAMKQPRIAGWLLLLDGAPGAPRAPSTSFMGSGVYTLSSTHLPPS
jgi:hypothetical protein